MTVQKEITVTFTEEDKAVLLAMHKLVSNLDCTYLQCDACPFQTFCNTCHPHSTPEEAIANLREALIDAASD